MKKCNKCKKIKSKKNFSIDKRNKDGLQGQCNTCKQEYKRSADGLIASIYGGQRNRSKKKNYPMPEYTMQELKKWAFDQKLFYLLYNNWTKSNFNKNLTPSIDRKDDLKPYIFDNIQLMTWKENKDKGDKSHKKGIFVAGWRNKKVRQLTKDNIFVKEYVSVNEAARKVKVSASKISACCLNKQKTSAGFIWEFVKQNKQ